MLGIVPENRPLPTLSPRVRRRRALLGAGVVVALGAGAFVGGVITGGAGSVAVAAIPTSTASPTPASPSATPAAPSRPAPAQPPAPVAVPAFNKAALSIDDPASYWVVVNKTRPLNPANFVPPDLVEVPVPYVWEPRLRQEAAALATALFAAASAEAGLQLQSQSAYRSYDSQVRVYNQEVASHGQAAADGDTARPGFSEHQTGLVIDISSVPSVCALQACFGNTPHGQWLASNAWQFGFLLRYPADKTPVTGYTYEPWHFRYIGTVLATEMHNTGITTLEEFFGLPAAPSY
jgi:D-alanyl-D-alanine carboxypeptidase